MSLAENDIQFLDLTEELLKQIRKSLKVFKPSKSLSMLSKLTEDYEQSASAEIDLVISGGGMKGYFMTGCYDILSYELKKRNVKIGRVAGASAGAWSGFMILTGMSTRFWIETYYEFKERVGSTIHEAYSEMWVKWFEDVIPVDAYKLCNGRLFISITVVTLFGLENRIISEFTSNEDMFEALCASSTIPFVSERWGYRRFRGEVVIDGSFSNDVPVFRDGSSRQLVIRLSELDYSMRLTMSSSDDCIEMLVLRGAMMMAEFLQGKKRTAAIAWLDRNESKGELENNYSYLSALTTTLYNNKWLFAGSLVMFRYFLFDNVYSLRYHFNNLLHTAWRSAKVLLLEVLQ